MEAVAVATTVTFENGHRGNTSTDLARAVCRSQCAEDMSLQCDDAMDEQYHVYATQHMTHAQASAFHSTHKQDQPSSKTHAHARTGAAKHNTLENA